jgi:hypothetical protein
MRTSECLTKDIWQASNVERDFIRQKEKYSIILKMFHSKIDFPQNEGGLFFTFPLCNVIERISKGMFALFLIALVLFCYASVIFLHLALVTEIPVFMTIIIQADNG